MKSVILQKNIFIRLLLLLNILIVPIPCPAQSLYVSNNANSTINKVDTNGSTTTFLSSDLNAPLGLGFDSLGNLYAANNGDNTVTKIASNGAATYFATVGTSPYGLAVDASNNVYVANLGSNSISRVTPLGIVSTFATGIPGPYGLAFDRLGNLFVSTRVLSGDSFIYKITPSGIKSIFASTSSSGPVGLAFDSVGFLYAADANTDVVVRYDNLGNASLYISGGLDNPIGLTFDAVDNLYISNFANATHIGSNTIAKYTPSGVLTTYANGLNSPTFLVFGPSTTVPEGGISTLVIGIAGTIWWGLMNRRKSS